jgi:hypothetical protein
MPESGRAQEGAETTDMSPPDALHELIRRQLAELSYNHDDTVNRLCAEMLRRHGNAVAGVLLYGSYLRGKRDTLLDFYVLLDDTHSLPRWQAWANRMLPPNVYYLALPGDPGVEPLRAKYATLTLAQFQRGMQAYQCYFWSRFTQPAGLVWVRDERTAETIADIMAAAVCRFVETAAPTLEDPFSSGGLWRHGFHLTYASELRSERPEAAAGLYEHNARHFDDLLEAYAANPRAVIAATANECYAFRAVELQTRAAGGSRLAWSARRIQGKLLSVARLVKAAGTFDDPLDYVLWKIQRHSGVYIEPTPRQRRHPLIFAWPLLWRIYRSGGFR